MDTADRKIERAYTVPSRPFQIRRSSTRTRPLLFAVAVAVTAGLPMAAGFRGINDPALSRAVCQGMLPGSAPANSTGAAPANSTTDFDWQSLKPSTEIHWTPCYGSQQCARLLLPLDYQSNGTSNATTAIALRMIPARDRANYKGSVLVNPGGPGGSGTAFVGSFGQNLSTIVGDKFDVLGFDPRGIGQSTPRLDCFGSAAARDIWGTQEGRQFLNASDDALLGFYAARAKVVGDRCAGLSETELGDIARFMGTASVATDMLKIAEKLGQDKVQYWGFSYGTVLGQYFSAMYPDKVGRVIIDGVLDGDVYHSAQWDSTLVDNEKVIDSLFTFCHQGGPLKCPLYESTPSAIRDRVYRVLASVEENAISVPLSEPPLVLTRKEFVGQLFNGAYTPLSSFPTIAATIHAIETANQTALTTLAPLIASTAVCNCSQASSTFALPDNSYEGFFGITCGDASADPGQPFDRAAFQAVFANLTHASPTGGPLWAQLYLGCTQWPVRAKWRYTGAFAARNTSHPLLVVSARFDPVCPLAQAQAVRERYGGAGLLVQNSYGHCSISAPSVCTAKVVRAYLEEGALPKEGTVCEPDDLPFVGWVNGVQARSEEDERLLEALRGLSKVVPTFGRGMSL